MEVVLDFQRTNRDNEKHDPLTHFIITKRALYNSLDKYLWGVY